jgi:hypothetical protein
MHQQQIPQQGTGFEFALARMLLCTIADKKSDVMLIISHLVHTTA